MKTIRTLMSCVVLVSALSSAVAGPNSEAARAKQLYEQGLKKFDVGRFEDAAKDFEEAYQIVAQPTILYNIAQAYRQAKNHAKALLFYRTYLGAYTRNGAVAPNANDVEQRIAEEQRIVDEAARTEQEARRPVATPEPKPEPSDSSAAKPTQPTIDSEATVVAKPRSRTPLFVGATLIGVGVVCLASGGGLLAVSGQRSKDIESASKTGGEFTKELREKQNQGQTFEKAGIALAVVGGVAAIAGVIPIALSSKDRSARPVAVLPILGRQVAGIQAEGRF